MEKIGKKMVSVSACYAQSDTNLNYNIESIILICESATNE